MDEQDTRLNHVGSACRFGGRVSEGGDAVDDTFNQSAGVSNQGSSEAQGSDLSCRALDVTGVSDSAYERAETRYGDEEELGADIRKRMSEWCTDKRVRRALEMDDASE